MFVFVFRPWSSVFCSAGLTSQLPLYLTAAKRKTVRKPSSEIPDWCSRRLAALVQGSVGEQVLAAYDRERPFGADENILNSSRTTRFMTPADGAERVFRDAVLHLAGHAAFARPLVNSGRLSRPCVYPLSGPDAAELPLNARPGTVAPDAPFGRGWLCDALGRQPVLLDLGVGVPDMPGLKVVAPEVNAEVRSRYLGPAAKALYLIRPDQIIVARWLEFQTDQIAAALQQIWGDAEWA